MAASIEKTYEGSSKLFNGIKNFYVNRKTCEKIKGEKSNWFQIK